MGQVQGLVASDLHANSKDVTVRALLMQQLSNNAFKPKLHRYASHMAEKACHVASYALQFGLT